MRCLRPNYIVCFEVALILLFSAPFVLIFCSNENVSTVGFRQKQVIGNNSTFIKREPEVYTLNGSRKKCFHQAKPHYKFFLDTENPRLGKYKRVFVEYGMRLFRKSAVLETSNNLENDTLVVAADTRRSAFPTSQPLVIINTRDSPSSIPRDANIKSYVLPLGYSDPAQYNQPLVRSRRGLAVYEEQCRKDNACALLERSKPVTPTPVAPNSLVVTIPQFLQFSRRVKSTPLGQRQIDVMFRGKTKYGIEVIDSHRKACIDAVRKLEKEGFIIETGRNKLTRSQYRRLLSRSKIMVSPFGYGEWSIKTYEAVNYGAIPLLPLKPLKIETFPNIYGKLPYCKTDFADLAEAVRKVLRNLTYWQGVIRNVQRTMHDQKKTFPTAVRKLEDHFRPCLYAIDS